ncbi:MAG: hypothetical protein M3Y49_05205 [Actinomycetota bacterium]|nr:hypothetical protein [Actinomycetota bacterium]
MRGRRRDVPELELADLTPSARAALEAAMAGDAVTLTRAGQPIGLLQFRSIALEGTVVRGRAQTAPAAPVPDGVTVVATTMSLSDAARRRLSDELGANYIVLDFAEAPPGTDVLLTHPISPQLLGRLRHQFPDARVVVTEIDDEELDIHYSGPVSRLLDAGASAYLPPGPIAELAVTMHAYLTQGDQPTLEFAPRKFSVALPAPQPQIDP